MLYSFSKLSSEPAVVWFHDFPVWAGSGNHANLPDEPPNRQGSPFLQKWCHFPYSRFAYSLFAYLLQLSAISPTHAKCDQNNVKQLKQAVQVYKVKGIVQKK